jgi:hypothetical protein
MLPMLNVYPEKRKSAQEMIEHPWLTSKSLEDYFMYVFCDLGIIKLIKD